MAAEVIKIASSLVPQYDGNGEKLSSVIAALTALKTVVTANTEALAVQIILPKLEKKARSAVGNEPANIDAIIASLKQKCKSHISADVILAKLNATRQNGALNKFTSELEDLTTQLETAYINDNIPIETATKMANKAGIKALASGLRNTNTQVIIKASTFSNLNEAVGGAAENDNNGVSTTNVLHYKSERQIQNNFSNFNHKNYGFRNMMPVQGQQSQYRPQSQGWSNNPSWRQESN